MLRETHASNIESKSILVTGGTESFGHRIVSELVRLESASIVVFSRDEKKQYDMEEVFRDQRNLPFILGDVREVMKGVDIVYHAAALNRSLTPSLCHLRPLRQTEVDPAVVPQICGQPGATGTLPPGLQPGNFLRRLALPAAVKPSSLRSLQVKLTKIGGRLVRQAVGVATGRGSCTQGGIPRNVGAHWQTLYRVRVVRHQRMLDFRGMRSDRGGGARLEELDGGGNVVKATTVASRTLSHDPDRWFRELDGMVDGVRD